MPTIGLDMLHYAKITEDAEGNETYGAPKPFGGAMQVNLDIEYAEGSLPVDDILKYFVKLFKSGNLTLGVDDIGTDTAVDIIGVTRDKNGVIVSSAEDISDYVAIGFRALRPNGKHRYFWLYRVMFSVPATTLQTKGDSITFNTPSITGKVMARNKVNSKDEHPWKIEVTEGDTGVSDTVIKNWFNEVYEPDFTAAKGD